jgi:hypothetical protein
MLPHMPVLLLLTSWRNMLGSAAAVLDAVLNAGLTFSVKTPSLYASNAGP